MIFSIKKYIKRIDINYEKKMNEYNVLKKYSLPFFFILQRLSSS